MTMKNRNGSNQHSSTSSGGDCNGVKKEDEKSIIQNPLLQHVNIIYNPSSSPAIHKAMQDLQTKGYHHLPSILTNDECSEAMSQLWEFVRDVSGGAVLREDPRSWYSKEQVALLDCHGEILHQENNNINSANENNCEDIDMDPWPHSDQKHDQEGMMQSLGAGYLLGNVREALADRVFGPLFGTEELLCSKEGFTFRRPMIVDLKEEYSEEGDDGGGDARYLVWNDRNNQALLQDEDGDGGQQYGQDVRVPSQPTKETNNDNSDDETLMTATKPKPSKKQYNKLQKKLNKQQRYKDITGLCHIQAAVSFTDQTVDQDRNGGHFVCIPYSYSKKSSSSATATATATATAGAGDEERKNEEELGEKIYANRGDVILWRSDLVHATVAPSLTMRNDSNKVDHDASDSFGYNGSREFGAVSYCSMLPVEAVKKYNLYSVPKHKMHKKMRQQSVTEVEEEMIQAKYKELTDLKLEAYRTGMTGDHRPEVENWHPHRRVTMWNAHLHGDEGINANVNSDDVRLIPPRLLQRPKFRLGAPKLTVRQAELYGLLSYGNRPTSDIDNTSSCDREEARRKEIERAVSRGIRFVEGVYNDKDRKAVGPWTMKDGRFTDEWGLDTSYNLSNKRIPICLATMEVLTPCSDNGEAIGLSGQDKYLGGMASPCGRYIYGVPGHAKQLIQVDVNTRKVETIGPEYHGEFKWLRGVEIPATDMGKKEDGSLAYPSGCCLALPCNSPDGSVLKVDPATASVSTFITDPIPNGAETGWLYHGGSLACGYVYAIPASASRVMKIGESKRFSHLCFLKSLL